MIKPSKEFVNHFKIINGAFSVTEMVALYNILLNVPDGIFCELGVAHGKSATIMVSEMKVSEVILVEPEFSDLGRLKEVAHNLRPILPRNISILPIAGYSIDVLPDLPMLAYCMVDSGSHQDGLPMQEAKLLENKMIQNGIIAFHDLDSQFKEVMEAYDYLLSTGKYEPIEINWEEIIDWVNRDDMETGNNSWHHNEIKNPCFLGAVKRK